MKILKNSLPPNIETVFLITLGMVLQMTDGSPFSLKNRWKLVWTTELPSEFFSVLVQKIIKSILSAIVVIRCTTTYAYVVSAVLVIFCVIKDTSPKLMLLWLIVSGVKSVFMTFSEAIIGVYVCSAFREIHKACIEFFIYKAVELILAAYLWGNVLNIYQEMERKSDNGAKQLTKEQIFYRKMGRCRQRARSLVDESTLYKTARLNNFEFRDVPQIILQMFRRGDEMSQDSLLGSGMMLASVSNLGSFDDLKITHSLGELGIVNLETTEVIGLDEDETLTYQEKALKFLKLTKSDASKIKVKKIPLSSDIYVIDSETWRRVAATNQPVNKPKKARTQVFIHDFPRMELECENRTRNKLQMETAKKFNFSVSVFLNDEESLIAEDELLDVSNTGIRDRDEFVDDSYSRIEEDDDFNSEENSRKMRKKWVHLFMSNINGTRDFRPNPFGIRSKKLKKNTFAELCNQASMNVIGSEVFENASKLPKVTSLSVLTKTAEMETSSGATVVSTEQKPLQEKNSFVNKSKSDFKFERNTQDYFVKSVMSFPREILKTSTETDSLGKENLMEFLFQVPERPKTNKKMSLDNIPQISSSYPSFNLKPTTNTDNKSKDQPIDGKSRISNSLKKEGKKQSKKKLQTESKIFQNPLPSGDSSSSHMSTKSISEESDKTEKSSSDSKTNASAFIPKTRSKEFSKNIYFLTELFQKPLWDVLKIYQDLKQNVEKAVDDPKNQAKDTRNSFLQNHYLKRNDRWQLHASKSKQPKVWKSNVLKMVQRLDKNRRSTKNFLKVIEPDSISLDLLERLARIHNCNSQLEVKYWLKSNLKTSESFDNFASDSSSFFEIQNQTISNEYECVMSKTDQNSAKNCKEYAEEHDKFITIMKKDEILKPEESSTLAGPSSTGNDLEEKSVNSQDSEEPISLYYSQAASLASPLFDMKRFIYPDHIHYSYKHVKKKGFDVDINGGLPLFVRENRSVEKPVQKGKLILKKPEITTRPMDLSFATTEPFTDWQNNGQAHAAGISSEKHVHIRNNTFVSKKERNDVNSNKNKKKHSRKDVEKTDSRSSIQGYFKSKLLEKSTLKYPYSFRDYLLIEKLLKLHRRFYENKGETSRTERKPVQISSAQLHSNKGRINSTYNPAISLQENKTRNEKKKTESPEERTKHMFARLEREVLLQNKNFPDKFKSNRK